MVQRHANETGDLARPKITIFVMLIFLIQAGFPTVSANDELDAMTLCDDVNFGLGGSCDDRRDADDETSSPTWVEAVSYTHLTLPTTPYV